MQVNNSFVVLKSRRTLHFKIFYVIKVFYYFYSLEEYFHQEDNTNNF